MLEFLPMAATDFRLGEFIVQPEADRLVSRDGARRVDLEPRTMAVLVVLAERSGQVVSSDELIHLVWHDRPMGDNPVYKAVTKLRRGLEDEPARPRYIETIPRKGYRLLAAPEPLGVDTQTAIRLPHEFPSATRATLPRPLAYLSASAAMLVVATLLASAGTVAARGSPGQQAAPEQRPCPPGAVLRFRGFDERDVARAAMLDAALRERLRRYARASR
jgi:DNA-binding winged helix-turn-helix (wHTH) protein